ncbi:MAG: acetylxylan esterase [Akkermansiaceae bacterium]
MFCETLRLLAPLCGLVIVLPGNAATVTPSSPAGTTQSWLQNWNNATVSDGTYLLPAASAPDTAIINQSRVIQVAAPVAVAAGTVVVNNTNGASLPNAKLEILPAGALTTGAITVSLNSDPGDLLISGGALTANGDVTVNTGGTFTLSGGSFTRGGTGTRTVFASGNGMIDITGGTLRATAIAATEVLGLFAETIQISGGLVELTGGQVIAGSTTTLIVSGDEAAISMDRLNLNSTSRAATIRFIFDETGVSAISSTGYLNLSSAKIEIDGSAYTGGAATFDLFLTPNLLSTSTDVTVTGFGTPGVDYTFTQDTADNVVRLALLDLHATKSAITALGGLTTAPAVFTDDTLPGTPATIVSGATLKVFYNTLDYQGSPTRACAWIGIPAGADAQNPVPAVVLAHGGGGKPYLEWVQMWNQRGYAAIAMGLEGQTDITATQAEKDAGQAVGNWLKHKLAGPPRVRIYGDSTLPVAAQWMYHAAADVILANSLLRALPEVDPTKIGLMGVSWGGVITATVIGIDDRFAFAIPVYGAGNKHTIDNHFGRALANSPVYLHAWDPDLRIHLATMPALWFSWPRENNFSLDSQAHTYTAAGGPRMVSLVPGMSHSHRAAWSRPESYDFADSIVASGTPWCARTQVSLTGQSAQVAFNSDRPLTAASLIHTADVGFTGTREWFETPAAPPVEGPAGTWTVHTTLPTDTTAWFVNAAAPGLDIDANDNGTTDIYGYLDENLVVSSDYQETRGLTVSPSGPLVMLHPSNASRSASTLYLGFLHSPSVVLTEIKIAGESHPGAFSHRHSLPWVLSSALPSRKALVIQFNNDVTLLPVSQRATATLTLSWQDPSDGSTGQILVPISAEIVDSGHVTGYDFATIFPLAASWSAGGPLAVISDVYDAADASSWSIGLPETDVFAFSLKGTSSIGGWTLRVGKGGQGFSLRANGDEWMAPQYRNAPTPGHAPWVDEVIQPVAINTTLNTNETSYFIHGAGIYLNDPSFADAPFYSPMLASRIDSTASRLNTANWAQHAHVPTAFQSGLINFQRITDRGEGIIEIEHVIYNGGPDALNRFNLPWMGARYSSLPQHYIYTGGGRSDVSADLFNPGNNMANLIAMESTDGFAAFTESSAVDAPCLMVVFGNAPPSGPPGFLNGAPDWRFGIAGSGVPDPLPTAETSWRNLRVGTARYLVSLLPGESLHARYFLVIGTQTAAKTLIAAHDLVARCGITKLSYSPTTPRVTKPWYASLGGPPLLPTETPGAGQEPWFHVSSVPAPGWHPLLVENRDPAGSAPAAAILTDNYYQLAHPGGAPADGNWKPYNGNTSKWSLLGFVPTSPAGIESLGLQPGLIGERLSPSNTIEGVFSQSLYAGFTGPESVTFGISGPHLHHRIPAGWRYHVEESQNLNLWSPRSAPKIATNTWITELIDTPDEYTPRKFYRLNYESLAQP